jgi:hypothetical protein
MSRRLRRLPEVEWEPVGPLRGGRGLLGAPSATPARPRLPRGGRGRLAGAALLALLAIAVSGACAAAPRPPQPTPPEEQPSVSLSAWSAALVEGLLLRGREDQEGRDGVGRAVATRDTATLRAILRADSARSRWLRAVVVEAGWPLASLVGEEPAAAAWLILQHSPFQDWQEEMLPTLERLAAGGDMPPQHVALFTDRLLVHRGAEQRFGSQFQVVDDRLLPHPVEDLSRLDERRAAMGLPPMAEYVRFLGEAYQLPVVWPPER